MGSEHTPSHERHLQGYAVREVTGSSLPVTSWNGRCVTARAVRHICETNTPTFGSPGQPTGMTLCGRSPGSSGFWTPAGQSRTPRRQIGVPTRLTKRGSGDHSTLTASACCSLRKQTVRAPCPRRSCKDPAMRCFFQRHGPDALVDDLFALLCVSERRGIDQVRMVPRYFRVDGLTNRSKPRVAPMALLFDS